MLFPEIKTIRFRQYYSEGPCKTVNEYLERSRVLEKKTIIQKIKKRKLCI